ncbi:excalibur calcium-binding domain-containing protein [Corynebacterium cystitidis]|uniref:Excalibur calcium-binding domain-containing protein n=1 Tax=Corynebacterium cystitidis DSM 20524 TaxID=1121357 RepID=A0A1H9WM28_9CORY|nr:excalibur calcium-binding domain-containing protein [Corynebacterium cystitidis]WJY82927.1 Excalibur calcium-binding domain protein [Corynebacterium cystitidis DSM 20524]SES34809.1 Excalibur calcium-binding domain-containing protein [Corynebacterium cystitidis DSM 20524]SNV68966.1 putative CheA signal transduction histidine kinase [Corynebacterium cystitidis]
MRSKLIAVATALAVATSPTFVAHAETDPATEIQVQAGAENQTREDEGSVESSSESSEESLSSGSSLSSTDDSGSSSPGLWIGLVAVAGVVAAAAGGAYWAIQEHLIPNPLPGIIPGPAPAPAPAPQPAPQPAPSPSTTYKNCTDVWNRLGRPIYAGEAGYNHRLDRDKDGVGCEYDPR